MEKPKERLTGLDADGYIISTEEATIIAARPVSEEEKKSIRMHILEKLYEYENLDEEFCNWKIDIKSPEWIINPHTHEKTAVSTTKYCSCCGRKIRIINS